MTTIYRLLAESVGRTLGRPVELIRGASHEQLRAGSVDAAFLCGLPYVRLRREHLSMLRALAAPVLDEPRYGDRPVYFSDVTVRSDSACRSFADLRGRAWAYNAPDSFSGCLAARHHLLQMGETEAFFGRVSFSGAHQESIRWVLEGRVDAAAIDSHVLAVERLSHPELASRLRVIAALGPASIPPVVTTARLPEELFIGMGDAFCHLVDDPVNRQTLARGLIRRFIPIDDGAYDDIRQKLDAVESSVPRGNQLAGLGT
jgi:phosphonate transport system substrate-binding protein